MPHPFFSPGRCCPSLLLGDEWLISLLANIYFEDLVPASMAIHTATTVLVPRLQHRTLPYILHTNASFAEEAREAILDTPRRTFFVQPSSTISPRTARTLLDNCLNSLRDWKGDYDSHGLTSVTRSFRHSQKRVCGKSFRTSFIKYSVITIFRCLSYMR